MKGNKERKNRNKASRESGTLWKDQIYKEIISNKIMQQKFHNLKKEVLTKAEETNRRPNTVYHKISLAHNNNNNKTLYR